MASKAAYNVFIFLYFFTSSAGFNKYERPKYKNNPKCTIIDSGVLNNFVLAGEPFQKLCKALICYSQQDLYVSYR